MRFGWSAFCSALVALSLVAARPAAAQVSAYVDFTTDRFTNNGGQNYLFGPTIGLTATLVPLSHLSVGADVRASLMGGKQRLDGIAVGPIFSFPTKGFRPYAEILTGFARYNDGLGTSTSASTNSQLEIIGGIDAHIKGHLDWRVAEFAYQQYFALGTPIVPVSLSTGIVYRFGAK
jgi:hypothetical protein